MKELQWINAIPERDPGTYSGGLRCLINGEVREWKGAASDVVSPIYQKTPNGLERRQLGKCALLDGDAARQALTAALKAYDKGRGAWPTSSVTNRIQCCEAFLQRMEKRRLEVVRLLTWEVAKSWADSLQEFDRTVAYGRATIAALKDMDRASSRFVLDSGFFAQVRRSPCGVALCMGPYNYPLNEMYTTLLPALIMGNTVVAKLPRMGTLCNLPLLEDFAVSFPSGVINIITGEGSAVATPIMETGDVDLLAFIGSARVANILSQKHPRPNRLREVLGLGAKNPAIILPEANLDLAAKECVDGALAFNGQRCTALKIIFAHRKIADEFTARVARTVSTLAAGMPFEDGVFLTPQPEEHAVKRMCEYVEDAVSHGARVMNPDGGAVNLTYFHPAVLYPVGAKMKIWAEEQFGPIVAIAPYGDPNEFLDYVAASPYGQQASIFGADPAAIGRLIDALMNQVCRVNLNTQCRRGPDIYPFNGRKDSAEGTLSVSDALRVFSIRTLVAAKESPDSTQLAQNIIRGRHSQFLTRDYLF
ncbi:MAG: aldehyde dehydrogenase family protein [Verrucomicrobia bacterium]|nr:aldehyde dehydrogenase family protein [Verrucomicrobiota bacterium]